MDHSFRENVKQFDWRLFEWCCVQPLLTLIVAAIVYLWFTRVWPFLPFLFGRKIRIRKNSDMTISLRRRPEDKLIELGGGANPILKPRCQGGTDICVDIRAATDAAGNPTVDFTCNFDEPLPIGSAEFDGVFNQFVLEHLNWRKVRQFINETFRILKPGGRCVCITANTEAQIEYIKKHPEGWDGKDDFDSFSCVLFGDLDYAENSHKNYLNPTIVYKLFTAAGYSNLLLSPYGAAGTDMLIQAVKPATIKAADVVDMVNKLESQQKTEVPLSDLGKDHGIISKSTENQVVFPNNPDTGTNQGVVTVQVPAEKSQTEKMMATAEGRQEVFSKSYFNGGGVHGGYLREGYWDYPVHAVTANHILARNPKSVLEVGAGRGYILKRIKNAGIQATGLEISKHCIMTRVHDEVFQCDLCLTPWTLSGPVMENNRWDLLYSMATMEHIPEQFLPAVIAEMSRVANRGLHGIDFGQHDDGNDKSHVSLHNREWWIDMFNRHAPGWPVEILDKEELERGEMPPEVLRGDGRTKLNVGSFTCMYHHGWTNLDLHDLTGFAQAYRYNFVQHDIRKGLPYGTGVVDCVSASHVLEHLSYEEGLVFLRECRRVIRPDGAIRIAVPDAEKLMTIYVGEKYPDDWNGTPSVSLSGLGEMNDDAAKYTTAAQKLWALLQGQEHRCFLDMETLSLLLTEAGFKPLPAEFCKTDGNERSRQIISETSDMHCSVSLYCDGIPDVG